MSHDTNEKDSDAGDPGAGHTSSTTVRPGWTAGQPSVRIVEAVVAATGREITDLPPLQHSVDTDALDALLTHDSSSVTVSFSYADIGVSVSGGGTIELHLDGLDEDSE